LHGVEVLDVHLEDPGAALETRDVFAFDRRIVEIREVIEHRNIVAVGKQATNEV